MKESKRPNKDGPKRSSKDDPKRPSSERTPSKEGLSSVLLVCGEYNNQDWRFLSSKHGLLAKLVLILLLDKIYAEKGYYCRWDDEYASLFIRFEMEGKSKTEYVKKVVEDAIELGFFDKDMFDKEHILTSKAIQTRWIFARRRCRQPETIKPEYVIQ